MTRRLLGLPLAVLLSLGMILTGCGGSGGTAGRTGTLSLYLTDAAIFDYRAVYVTIDKVEVHSAGDSWATVAAPNRTYNLLELINGALAPLGSSELPGGDYTQMRLLIGATPDDGQNVLGEEHPFANYLVLKGDDSVRELKVPGGLQTGLKVVGGFRIVENVTVEMLLDFDAGRSVVKAGRSGQWLLKPTVKVLHMVEKGVLAGSVSDAATGDGLPGALVGAQTEDPGARVTVQAGTLTNEQGEYQLFLADNPYHVVAFAAGYAPACVGVDIAFGESREQNFVLEPSPMGGVSGTIGVAGAAGELVVTLSFRKDLDCAGDGGDLETVEIRSEHVAVSPAGADYEVPLPVGAYTLVASAPGHASIVQGVTVTEGAPAVADISFE